MNTIPFEPDLLVLHGSRLYGNTHENSDYDYRGFVVESYKYLIGRKHFEQYEDTENDIVIYGSQKFFKLAEKGNMQIIEALYAPKENIIHCSTEGEIVINNRELFMTQDIAEKLRGYASNEYRKSQLLDRDKETGEIYQVNNQDYVPKYACHAIRLLEQAIEIVQTGHLTMPRPNAEELKRVRAGEFNATYLAKRMMRLIGQFKKEEEKTQLPKFPDKEKIDELYERVIQNVIANWINSRKERCSKH